MEKKQKDEGLQSRREFFKNVAKGSLPILGAMMLANTPTIIQAKEAPMGCTGTCYGSCKNGCQGCQYTCAGTCKNSCKGTCQWSSK